MREARVHLARDGDIAVIVTDHPPINAGSTAVRQGILAALQQVEADVALQAAVLIGAGCVLALGCDAGLEAGFDVLLLAQDAAALERGASRIHGHFAGRVQRGKLKASAAAAAAARLQASLDGSRLAEADLVIEAVFEDLAVKRPVFKRIDALATGLAVGKRLKKTVVLTGNPFGFIGNRLDAADRRQCECMVEEGASPEQVDAALQRFGCAMGPCAVADLSGRNTLLLADGVAERATDVDVVLVNGDGFPRWEGGPVLGARKQAEARRPAGLDDLARASGTGFVCGDLRHVFGRGVPA